MKPKICKLGGKWHVIYHNRDDRSREPRFVEMNSWIQAVLLLQKRYSQRKVVR